MTEPAEETPAEPQPLTFVWPDKYPLHDFTPDHASASGGPADICHAHIQTAWQSIDGFDMEIQCGLTRADHEDQPNV